MLLAFVLSAGPNPSLPAIGSSANYSKIYGSLFATRVRNRCVLRRSTGGWLKRFAKATDPYPLLSPGTDCCR